MPRPENFPKYIDPFWEKLDSTCEIFDKLLPEFDESNLDKKN